MGLQLESTYPKLYKVKDNPYYQDNILHRWVVPITCISGPNYYNYHFPEVLMRVARNTNSPIQTGTNIYKKNGKAYLINITMVIDWTADITKSIKERQFFNQLLGQNETQYVFVGQVLFGDALDLTHDREDNFVSIEIGESEIGINLYKVDETLARVLYGSLPKTSNS